MDRQVSIGIHVVKCHVNHLSNSPLVDMVHGKGLDVEFLDNLFLKVIKVPQANIDKLVCLQ